MEFLLDENVPVSIKKVINTLGHKALTLHDFDMLGIQNGEVAKLALNENVIIITLDSDFLRLKKTLQKKRRIIYIKIHPRDPKKIRDIINNNLKNIIPKLKSPCILTITEDNVILEKL